MKLSDLKSGDLVFYSSCPLWLVLNVTIDHSLFRVTVNWFRISNKVMQLTYEPDTIVCPQAHVVRCGKIIQKSLTYRADR